ncbi:hypothetical protein Deba_3223 [Desulfarculus baarsii DSM 2075]|uniref:Uncharacterized protein n=1 Tax=Desulfarculus baarsii (strain ATCC 33931 / DSM 2075 / LMG 7858 / VKM B-1802 / 2st14) TaxID=644282 RepID=E1QLZ1_DESB2|nr:hypothetical protein [Desulfarculus baarsii]ADK86576.1 hypothetical protein Deba_3223 [Desulfarculus baarsii DSM 2075]
MLDPATPSPVDLKDFSAYIASCAAIADQRLQGYAGIEAVARDEAALNEYPRLGRLRPPQDVLIIDQPSPAALDAARQSLLRGEVLLEHACAGEATRLGLGPKYLLSPASDLTPAVLRDMGLGKLAVKPTALSAMSLGRRHMLQLAWDLGVLAQEAGLSPDTVLGRQWLLIIVGETSAERIMADFSQANFYGFDPAKALFMIQRSFHGLDLRPGGGWAYDLAAPKRLHNHGQMLMQSTMNRQILRIDSGGKRFLEWDEYRMLLEGMVDKVSFNIEDLGYLNGALDLTGLATALELGGQGFGMVMEVVANNPRNPQKGGALYHDPQLGRDVMIESFQLRGVRNEDIAFLNKNINHYPNPAKMAAEVRRRGLSMPVSVKNGYLYFQPVQGDVNFLLPTAFVRRALLEPISAWKSAADTEAALKAMLMQERRPGFMTWAENITGLRLQKV